MAQRRFFPCSAIRDNCLDSVALAGLPNIKDDAHVPFVRLEPHDAPDEATHGVQLGLIVTIMACAAILGGYYLL
jgi:hypothetical protein